jgi:hypothetical protein
MRIICVVCVSVCVCVCVCLCVVFVFCFFLWFWRIDFFDCSFFARGGTVHSTTTTTYTRGPPLVASSSSRPYHYRLPPTTYHLPLPLPLPEPTKRKARPSSLLSKMDHYYFYRTTVGSKNMPLCLDSRIHIHMNVV